jgi:hypothetical protein
MNHQARIIGAIWARWLQFSGRDAPQEGFDFVAQAGSGGFDRLRGHQYCVGRIAVLGHRTRHAIDYAHGLLGAGSRARDIMRDFTHGGNLLLQRSGHRGRETKDFVHASGVAADRLDRATGGASHRCGLGGDLIGRLGGLHGKRFDLGRHRREALARFANARGLNRRIKREQIGPAGDAAESIDHVADFLRGFRQPENQDTGGNRKPKWRNVAHRRDALIDGLYSMGYMRLVTLVNGWDNSRSWNQVSGNHFFM